MHSSRKKLETTQIVMLVSLWASLIRANSDTMLRTRTEPGHKTRTMGAARTRDFGIDATWRPRPRRLWLRNEVYFKHWEQQIMVLPFLKFIKYSDKYTKCCIKYLSLNDQAFIRFMACSNKYLQIVPPIMWT